LSGCWAARGGACGGAGDAGDAGGRAAGSVTLVTMLVGEQVEEQVLMLVVVQVWEQV
jgi:hypothetical protein